MLNMLWDLQAALLKLTIKIIIAGIDTAIVISLLLKHCICLGHRVQAPSDLLAFLAITLLIHASRYALLHGQSSKERVALVNVGLYLLIQVSQL